MSRPASPMPHLRFVVAICAALLSIAVLAPAAHAADGLTSGALISAVHGASLSATPTPIRAALADDESEAFELGNEDVGEKALPQ